MSGYQGVIFDLDGTLYLQKNLRRRMMARLAVELAPRPHRWSELKLLNKFRRMREELAQHEVSPISRLQYEFCAQALDVSPRRLQEVVDYWMHQAPLPYLRARRAPGIAGLWESLTKAGIKLAVCSDYPVDQKLAALGLSAEVTVWAGEPEVELLKPHPAGLLLAARRMGLEPQACLVIGDRPERDGEAARRANMDFLLYAPRSKAGPQNSGPQEIQNGGGGKKGGKKGGAEAGLDSPAGGTIASYRELSLAAP